MQRLGTWCITFAAMSWAPAESLADWRQFRGPGGCAVSPEKDLPVEWSATKNMIWKTPLPGPGASSPIVFGDHVYVTCYSGYGVNPRAPGNRGDLKRHLICVHRDSGKVLWNETFQTGADDDLPYPNVHMNGYAAHTPVTDESGVYVYFGPGGAFGYSHNGEKKWRAPCGPKTAKPREDTSAGSLIVHGDLLIFNDDHSFHPGATIALDKRTGREVWREKLGGCYVGPLLMTVDGNPHLILGTQTQRYLGVDPASGKRLWHCNAPIYAASPTGHDGILYVTGGDRRAAIKPGGTGDITSDRTRRLWDAPGGVIVSSPVYYNGHLYWCSDRGDLAFCAEARDKGKIVYRERLPDPDAKSDSQIFASPVVAADRVYYVSRQCGAYVLAAGPKFQLLAHNKIAGDDSLFNGTPAVSRGRIFLRSDRFLYCIGKNEKRP